MFTLPSAGLPALSGLSGSSHSDADTAPPPVALHAAAVLPAAEDPLAAGEHDAAEGDDPSGARFTAMSAALAALPALQPEAGAAAAGTTAPTASATPAAATEGAAAVHALPPFGPDPAGDITTTETLTLGVTRYGEIGVGNDQDFYAVQLEAGVSYQFRLFGVGGTDVLVDPELRLYDSTGTPLASNDDGGNGFGYNSQLNFTAGTSGTYYIDAASHSFSATGSYMLTAVEADPAGVVLTDDEISWQLTNNFERYFEFGNQGGNVRWTAYDVSDNGRSITYNGDALTSEGRTLLVNALQMWSDVTGITFQYAAAGAELVADDNAGGTTAYNSNNTDPTSGEILGSSLQVTTGWLGQFGTSFNSYSFETYIHELGHALGLGHGGNYNGSAIFGTDNWYVNDSQHLSIMSYMQSRNDEFASTSFGYNDYVNAEFRWVLTPMIADILAMDHLYGLSTTTRTGDTVYGYNSTTGNSVLDQLTTLNDPVGRNFVAFTVFDNGGTDTVDMSGFGGDQYIDLREGHSSSVLGGTLNMGIAYGTVVENAYGGGGNDVLHGNEAANHLSGGSGGLDILYGYGGADRLDGGSAPGDVLIGGRGDDSYYLQTLETTVSEFAGQGIDTVHLAGSYTLGLALERLVLEEGGNFSGYGNELDNRLTGNSGDNTLRGRDGTDQLYGGGGSDTLLGGSGADYLSGGSGSDTAYYLDSESGLTVSLGNAAINTGIATGDTYNSIENLTGTNFDDILNGLAGGSSNIIRGGGGNDYIKGYSGLDTLYGGADNDILDGGLDADLLYGGSGTDTATYSGASASVTASLSNSAVNAGEAAGDVYSSIENLTGSGYGDILNGDNGNNAIDGGAGDDLIKGYRGTDTLTGGTGADAFVFASVLGAGNLGRITDFSVPDDTIRLDDAYFTSLSTGVLGIGNFRANSSGVAQDADDYIVYNASNGYLYYDADGSGAGGRVYFATVTAGLALTAADFLVI